MVLVITYSVVRRYALRRADAYAYEVASILMILSFIFALPAVEKDKRLLRMDLIIDFLPHRLRLFIRDIFGSLIGAVFCGVLCWRTAVDAFFALEMKQVTISAWRVPTFPIKFAILAAYILWFLLIVLFFLRESSKVRKGDDSCKNW
jgi:TRAP-type C4-dicarboxylate transport system permease small subunit